MTKTRAELWRPEREKMLHAAVYGMPLLRAVGNRLEGMRNSMHEALELPPPGKYATASVENIRLLCDDLDCLTVALVLRARGLTSQSDETLADAMVRDIEEDMFDYPPNTRGH